MAKQTHAPENEISDSRGMKKPATSLRIMNSIHIGYAENCVDNQQIPHESSFTMSWINKIGLTDPYYYRKQERDSKNTTRVHNRSFVHEFFPLQNGPVETGSGIHPEIGDRSLSVDLDISQ